MFFELVQIEVQCSKNYFRIFLPKEAGSFPTLGNNIEKELQKPRQRLKKYVYYIFTDNICSACKSNPSGSFLQKCINSAEQQLKFSHVEGSIRP